MAFSKKGKFLSSILVSIPLLFNSVNSFAKTNPTSINSAKSYSKTNYVTNKDGVGFWYSIDYDQVSNRVGEVEGFVNNPLGYLKDKLKITILPEESEEIGYLFRENNPIYNLDSLGTFLVNNPQEGPEISHNSSEYCSSVKGEYSGISLERGYINKNKKVLNKINLSQKDSIPKILKTKSGIGVTFGEDLEFSAATLEVMLGTDNKKGINFGVGIKGDIISKAAFKEGEKGYIVDYSAVGGISYKGIFKGRKITPYFMVNCFPSSEGWEFDNSTLGIKAESIENGIGVHVEYSPENNRISLGGEIKFH